ncbi:MAG: type II toxin-antitoxin system Phd/YefM family antitoxin [Rhodocyclales bacterium]|nr:type II toxin-antitoxin system Phd/YefM family antitoxin [Rhodocyclales bacterium]
MSTVIVSVSEFRARCADYLRLVEKEGASVGLTRNGVLVARLENPSKTEKTDAPWLRLRGRGRLSGPPSASVLHEIS